MGEAVNLSRGICSKDQVSLLKAREALYKAAASSGCGLNVSGNNNYLFHCNKEALSNWEQIIIRDDSKFDKVTLLQSNT